MYYADTLQRLVFLAIAHRQYSPTDPEDSLDKQIKEWQPWFTINKESTFHTIRSLQRRASTLVMSSQNDPNMAWKEDSNYTVLYFKGAEVSLPNLVDCQGALEDQSMQLLLHNLLFDHPFYIDISKLKDDMGNSVPGYSLFTDRVNRPVLGSVDALAEHILATPSLREQFVVAIEDGKIIWNPIYIKR